MNIEIFIRTIAKNQFNDIHIYVTKESLFEYYVLIKYGRAWSSRALLDVITHERIWSRNI